MPQPAHNLTTSPELLRRRQLQQAAAQALTCRLIACGTVAEARSLYEIHGENFNGIHFSALFTALVRLATRRVDGHAAINSARSPPRSASSPPRWSSSDTAHTTLVAGDEAGGQKIIPPLVPPMLRQCIPGSAPAVPTTTPTRLGTIPSLLPPPLSPSPSPSRLPLPSHSPPSPTEGLQPHPVGRSRIGHSSLSRTERADLHGFVAQQLLPHLGLRLMSLGPRQLVTVLAALAQLDCPPPGFWLSEWLQHFARRLDVPPPPLGPMGLSLLTAVHGSSSHSPERAVSGLGAATAASPFGAAAPAAARAAASVKVSMSAVVEDPSRQCGPGEIGRAMWSLAHMDRLRRRRATTSAAYDPWATSPSAAREAAPAGSASGPADEASGGDGSGPSLVWLETVSFAFSARAAAARPADIASYLWGAARLGYRPPKAVMAALLDRCNQLMVHRTGYIRRDRDRGASGAGGKGAALAASAASAAAASSPMGPRELCVVLWAFAVLGFSPGRAWLQRVAEELEDMAADVAVPEMGSGETSPEATATAKGPSSVLLPTGSGGEGELSQPGASTDVAGPRVPGAAVAAAAAKGGWVSGDSTPPNGRTASGSPDPGADDSDWWSIHLGQPLGGDSAVTLVAAAVSSRPEASSTTPLTITAAVAVAAASTALIDRRRGGGSGGGEGGSRGLTARQAATCTWAFARLGYQPPQRLLTALLRRACLSPSAAPPPTAQDLSMSSFALGVLQFRPAPDQALALLEAMGGRLRDASPQDLVVWASALARMRLAIPDPWFDEYVQRAAAEVEALPPLALVNWVDAVARLRTARGPRRSRRPSAVVMVGPATAAAPTRSPLPQDGGDGGEASGGGRGSGDCGVAMTPAAGSEVRDGMSDPWVVVALPKARRPRAEARKRKPAQQRQHILRRHLHPPPTQPTSDPDTTMPAATPSVSPGANAAVATATAQPPAAGKATPGPVFIRPAAWHLRRGWFLPRLLRLASARLPQLDLEQHCRLAWAVAHLHTRVRPVWVARLLAHTGQVLEQRLRLQQRAALRLRQQEQRQQQEQQEQHAAKAAVEAAAAAVPPPPAMQRLPVVVDARWVLKLVRAVELLRRGPRRAGDGYRAEVVQRRQRRMLLRGNRGKQAMAMLAAHGETAAVKARPSSRPVTPRHESPYSRIPRRWRLLMMMAVLPQLSTLSNSQLLRFVRTMGRLRTHNGEAGPRGAASGRSEVRDDTGAAAAAPVLPAMTGEDVGVGVRGVDVADRAGETQQRLAAELGGYCRRRVAATCGNDEACDITTWELLRWTSALEDPRE